MAFPPFLLIAISTFMAFLFFNGAECVKWERQYEIGTTGHHKYFLRVGTQPQTLDLVDLLPKFYHKILGVKELKGLKPEVWWTHTAKHNRLARHDLKKDNSHIKQKFTIVEDPIQKVSICTMVVGGSLPGIYHCQPADQKAPSLCPAGKAYFALNSNSNNIYFFNEINTVECKTNGKTEKPDECNEKCKQLVKTVQSVK